MHSFVHHKMRLIVYCLTALLFISHDGCCMSFHISDILNIATQATTGVLESIPRSIPSPFEFFNLGKNALIGLPYKVAYSLINQFCM